MDAPVATPGVSTKRPDDDDVPKPPLRVAAALAAAGCVESSYLAFEKIVGGDVACPLSGCQTALTSGYSELFGVPLSAYGAASYGLVAALAWWGAGMRDEMDADDESASASADAYARARLLVFLAGAGLAGVSTYLLYVLAVPLGGAECVYCLTSAAISFTVAADWIFGAQRARDRASGARGDCAVRGDCLGALPRARPRGRRRREREGFRVAV